MSAQATPELLWDLVEESLDEAEFLWRRWDLALSSHDHDLRGISYWIEDRLLGSLSGVQVAGDAAIETLLAPALLGEAPARAAVAAHVLGLSATPAALEALLSAFQAATPEQLPALMRGVELLESPEVLRAVGKVSNPSPEFQAAMLDASSFGRRVAAPTLVPLLPSESPVLQRAVVTAARHAPRDIGEYCALHGLHHYGAPGARSAAIETGLIFGAASAWQACTEDAAKGTPGTERQLLLLALLGIDPSHEAIFRALAKEPVQKAALFALGFIGTTRAADTCIELMNKEPLAQLAADSFCTITGLDLDKEKLIAPEPAAPQEPVPFEEENLEANLVPTQDDLLPRPDTAGVARWWAAHRPRFQPGARYLGGIPVNLHMLHGYLDRGAMRRRHGVALELAVRTGGKFQLETRAFAVSQRRQSASFPSVMSAGIPPSPLASLFSRV